MSIPIHTGSYNEFLVQIMENAETRVSHYACVANVHMLVEAYTDYDLANVICNADIVTPDGMPLTWALIWLYGIRQERVAGMDLLPDLLLRATEKRMPVYFYGGDEALLEKTNNYIRNNYPDLVVAGLYSPPFRSLTEAECDDIVDRINDSGAKLVFVILGCPKQEKWMASMFDRINAAMIGIGGALPVMVGMQKRAPKWAQEAGMEWLFRLWQEPYRLFRRYAVTNSLFICLLAKAYLFRKRTPKIALS